MYNITPVQYTGTQNYTLLLMTKAVMIQLSSEEQ